MVLFLCHWGKRRLNSSYNSKRNGELDETIQLRIKALLQSST